jgi:hypothetical protein
MRLCDPIASLMRAALLALLGLALSAGVAAAHGGHKAPRAGAAVPAVGDVRQTAAHPDAGHHATGHHAAGHLDAERDELAVSELSWIDGPTGHDHANRDGLPCRSSGEGAGHFSGSCCTVACHAALTSAGVLPPVPPEPPHRCVATLADTLEGRSSDRAERPPRLG